MKSQIKIKIKIKIKGSSNAVKCEKSENFLTATLNGFHQLKVLYFTLLYFDLNGVSFSAG